jgi:hypothetical protein
MAFTDRLHNRGSIGGYDIENSCKFEIDNSECLTKTFGSSGNRKAWTWSSWVKRTELNSSTTYQLLFSAGTGNPPRDVFFFDDDTDDTLCFFSNGGLFSSAILGFRTNAVFRDTSAWYHIVLVLDTANSTAADRLKLYVNGVSQTFSTYNAPTQNADSLINSNTDHAIARDSSFAALGFDAQYFSGYMAETHFVDGSALAPTDFGEYDEDSGIWKPKQYTGSYGTNGFYLDFADAADLGDDESGNGNDWTEVNITAADQATDTPTNNFCTWNPLQTGWNTNYGTGQVIVEGATEAYASTNYAAIEGSMAVQSGKWYWESKPNRTGGIMVGVAALNGVRWAGDTAYWYLGVNAQGIGTILGNWYYNGTSTSTDATDWTNGDIVSIALDMDNYKIYMAVNGSWGGTSNPSTGTGGYDFSSASNFTSNFVVPAGRIETANSSYVIETNFGGYTTMSIASGNSDSSEYGNFEYAPPSGYYALCTKNLAEYG